MIVHEGRVVGQGQQLAAARVYPAFERPTPEGSVTRQQLRRVDVKRARQDATSIRRNLDALALAEMRGSRMPWTLPRQVPGKLAVVLSLAQSARAPGSRKGAASRRILATEIIEGGQFEAAFHATKGRRRVRIAA